MDREAIRHACVEATAVATSVLSGDAEPPVEQVERLREVLTGHVEALVDATRARFSDAPPGALAAVVDKTIALAEDLLSLPVQDGVLDLLVVPPLARTLLLMFEEAPVFGASCEASDPFIDDWAGADAV
ncbi:hypothetical protein [Streptomyces laculatispora]|uniref:hypothetical protein n=1 Tax=Streptomyces laculatispora TaxID=887464 RepID=UPI001A94CB08|nr:hypothetical protein [Streptomyces laculatispora]MBO0918089.1 hypothetical protein [Streptomyces laculatispora]